MKHLRHQFMILNENLHYGLNRMKLLALQKFTSFNVNKDFFSIGTLYPEHLNITPLYSVSNKLFI